MSTALISRWARRYLLASACFLCLAHLAGLAGAPVRVEVVFGLYGFVLTTVFGKAYSLVPAYFDRALAWPHAPAVQLPLVAVGVVALGLAGWDLRPELFGPLGALSWSGGVAVFLGTLAATVRDNPTGRETGTGAAESARRGTDRLANAFVPLALVYLGAGTLAELARWTTVPGVGGSAVRTAHLLGPGFALLVLFAVGFRLLPRLLASSVDRSLAAVVLPSGALAPALLAAGYPAGPVFRAGAVLESVAVVGFGAAYIRLFVRTDRDRVGLYGPLLGVCLGSLGVALGAQFAFVGIESALAQIHLRLNVFGLLGLTIVGVVFQFYPPAIAAWPGAGTRLAAATLGALATGLLALGAAPAVGTGLAGRALLLAGSVSYLYLVGGAIRT